MNGWIGLGILLIFIGFAVMMLAMVLSAKEGKVEGGGVVLIGPIPIVFGTNKDMVKIVLLVLLVILLALLIMRWSI